MQRETSTRVALAALIGAAGLHGGCAPDTTTTEEETGETGETVQPASAGAVLLGAAAVVIELTDNDIEFQAFTDGSYTNVALFNPAGIQIYKTNAQRKLRTQGGLTDHFFASVPTHYLEDEPEFDGTIEEFLGRFPEGTYTFLGSDLDGAPVTGEATLNHVFAALPEIVTPVQGDTPPIVDRNNVVIDWEPVTTQFDGSGPVDVVEYQVVVEHETLRRPRALIDGTNRKMVVNLTSNVTRLRVPATFMLPNTEYAFEIIAAEATGSNTSISAGSFVTSGN